MDKNKTNLGIEGTDWINFNYIFVVFLGSRGKRVIINGKLGKIRQESRVFKFLHNLLFIFF